jgi:hypothetical protein
MKKVLNNIYNAISYALYENKSLKGIKFDYLNNAPIQLVKERIV